MIDAYFKQAPDGKATHAQKDKFFWEFFQGWMLAEEQSQWNYYYSSRHPVLYQGECSKQE